MLGKAAIDVLGRGISALASDATKERNKVAEILKAIASHPIKVLASFIAAPILIIKIALIVKSPIRRAIAIVGLLVSLLLSYLAASIFGSLAGAIFIASHVGILAGIGFFLGATIWVYLSVIFSILVFNSVSFLFLKVSSQDVVDYLQKIST
jgi:hypothetical protein